MSMHDYWIRAETFEVDLDSPGPPYPSAGNLIEGILHYRQSPEQLPRATDYQAIKQKSIPYSIETCANIGGCLAVNCPFVNFYSSYNTRCHNVDQLRRLEPTPSEQMPSAEVDPDCPDCEILALITTLKTAVICTYHAPDPHFMQADNTSSPTSCALTISPIYSCMHTQNHLRLSGSYSALSVLMQWKEMVSVISFICTVTIVLSMWWL